MLIWVESVYLRPREINLSKFCSQKRTLSHSNEKENVCWFPRPPECALNWLLVTSLARMKEEGAGCRLLSSFIQLLGPFQALLCQKADAESSKSGTHKAKPQHSRHLSAGCCGVLSCKVSVEMGEGALWRDYFADTVCTNHSLQMGSWGLARSWEENGCRLSYYIWNPSVMSEDNFRYNQGEHQSSAGWPGAGRPTPGLVRSTWVVPHMTPGTN